MPSDIGQSVAANSSHKKSKLSRVKKDEMWKHVLRPFRQHIQKMFNDLSLSKGKAKWKDDMIM